ncbi:MAG: WecB/TagA/CpsF family glycosyltransferase [Acidobacteriaceae bacterium]|nr:WecB/TagA/CpsF family glycosyltransferase [Acidobacteriaceae bacterium]
MASVENTLILGMKVSRTDYQHASSLILSWAKQKLSRYVCVATVNNVMEAFDSEKFQTVMNQADLVTPDGMPVVWALRCLGRKNATRVYGPDLTHVLLEKAAAAGVPVGFYGAAPEVLQRLVEQVQRQYPQLRVVYAFSPPFRPLSAAEDEEIVRAINGSGAAILFIGLNTPKQDNWMAAHRDKVRAVMLGVGAAFDFLAGTKPQAPRWMMAVGLEWLFRLAVEPRRLWKRYLKHNPRFVLFFAMQLLRLKYYDVELGSAT